MLKKTITYTSLFTEQPVTEDHYFHISKADLVEMEMEEHRDTYQKDGKTLTGMQAKLQRIIDSQDGKAIIAELKDIVRRSYGKKDGDRFLKSREISNDFLATEAASELLFEICTNADTAAEFINGIIPGNLEQISAEIKADAAREEAKNGATAASSTSPKIPFESPELRDEVQVATPENPVVLNATDVVEMESTKFQAGIMDGRYKLS